MKVSTDTICSKPATICWLVRTSAAPAVACGLLLTAWVSARHGYKVFHACNPMNILRLADAIIATNESYKAVVVARGGKNPEEVFVVRNGPDLRRFARPPLWVVPSGKPITVGYLGNMNLQDGVDLFVNAVAASFVLY